MVQLYWLGIHAGIFLRHAITLITLKTKIFIFIDAFISGGVSLIIIKPKYVLLLTAGRSYQKLLTPLLAACTEFTISDSAIKQKLISERFFFPTRSLSC